MSQAQREPGPAYCEYGEKGVSFEMQSVNEGSSKKRRLVRASLLKRRPREMPLLLKKLQRLLEK